MKARRLITGLVLLALMLGGAVIGVAQYARWKVVKKLPKGVTAGSVELHLDGVVLRKVHVERGWVVGTLDEVWVSRDQQTMTVTGGDLIVDLDKKPAGGDKDGEARKVTASKIRAIVHRGDVSALVEGASWDGSLACFTTADVTAEVGMKKPLGVHVGGGCVDRNSGHAWALIATSHVTDLPDVPGMKPGAMSDVWAAVDGIDVRWGDADYVSKSGRPYSQLDVKVDGFDLGPVSGKELVFSDDPDVGKNLSVGTLTVNHPWIHTGPVTFEHGVQVAAGHWHPGHGLPSGWVTVRTQDPKSKDAVSGSKGVSLKYDLGARTLEGGAQSCFDWVQAVPEPLRKPLPGSWEGKLSFKVEMRPAPKLTLDAKCKAYCSHVPNLLDKGGFGYTAYRSDGTTFVRKTGPGTPGWLPISEMGKMPTAVINMEDLAFPYHHGYLEDAFQNSLTDNVARGKFARGGSTITQQAAKNLWLTRDKTIGRKVAELFLAQALEGCYSKDQIMEVYLNIVEFAPDVYGAKDGAKHWFGKGPGDLDDVEAFWLAGVLPRPRKVGPPTKESMAATEKLMESMAKQGRIPGFVGSGEDVDMAGWGTE